MFKKFILYFFISLVLIFSNQHTSSQESKTQEDQEKDELTYKVKVTVTTVDVIVTDKKGNRIKGLTKDNFEIYEDGILQNITNFFEIKGMEVLTKPDTKKEENHS